jgi:hypothetical protein
VYRYATISGAAIRACRQRLCMLSVVVTLMLLCYQRLWLLVSVVFVVMHQHLVPQVVHFVVCVHVVSIVSVMRLCYLRTCLWCERCTLLYTTLVPPVVLIDASSVYSQFE